MNVLQIAEGWRNDIIPPKKLKELINSVSKQRLDICKKCEAYSLIGEGCAVIGTAPCCNNKIFINNIQGCGCPLKKKTKCLSCECPAKKWLAIETNKSINEK